MFCLNHLVCLQARIENMCGLIFPSLINHCNVSILGLTCPLLAGEVQGSLQPFCPKFKSTSLRVYHWLHILIQLVICIFITLAIFTLYITFIVAGKSICAIQFQHIFYYEETVMDGGGHATIYYDVIVLYAMLIARLTKHKTFLVGLDSIWEHGPKHSD